MTIVRTPTKALGGITPAEKAALDAHAQKWIANAMSTEPVCPERLVPAVEALYAAAGLKKPRVVIVSSPQVMAFAGGFADAIWWARKNHSRALRDNLVTRAATDAATYDATYDATDDATYAATYAATYDATHAATRAATDAATYDATHAATHDATRAATRDATHAATHAATRAATRDATHAATHAATRAATRAATYAATYDATHAATRAATRAATDAATYAATRAATDAATDAATYDATRVATDAATRDATDAATYDATDAATHDATDAATHDATDAGRFALLALRLGREFGVSDKLMLQCAQQWWRMYQGGNMWSSWDSYVSAFRDVLGLVLPEHDKYSAWEACAVEGGFRVVHEEFCIVSDRPELLTVDAENRPHNESGPSHRWRDGWALYHWHGMRVPDELAYIIHSPQSITVEAIEAQTNSELRRVMIDRYGPARFVVDSGAIVVHELPADHSMQGLRTARLLRKDVQDDEPIVYVDLLNSTPEPDGTTRRYMLRVDPNAYGGEAARNAHAAAASTWRDSLTGALTYRDWRDYAPVAES